MTHFAERVPDAVPRVSPGDSLFETDMRAGYAHSMFVPGSPRGFSEKMFQDLGRTTFNEMPEIMALAVEGGSVLVQGEPGSGKSHLVDDLTMVCAANNVAYATLRVHINGGKVAGPANAKRMFDRFRGLLAGGAETQALVVVDNVDYLGYKGHRSGGRTRQYAVEMDKLLAEVVGDKRFITVGTGHDDEWREGRWKWDDSTINAHARHALELFETRVVFEGSLSLLGLVDLIRGRAQEASEEKVSKGEAEEVVYRLANSGLATYFYAKHIDPRAYLADPQAEIKRIEAGRVARKIGRS